MFPWLFALLGGAALFTGPSEPEPAPGAPGDSEPAAPEPVETDEQGRPGYTSPNGYFVPDPGPWDLPTTDDAGAVRRRPVRAAPPALRPGPARPSYGPTGRGLHFASEEAKARWLGHATHLDSLHPTIVDFARRFRRLPPPERAVAIHRFVRDRIAYVRDPGGEEFADAPTVLARGYDDCDGKARLFVALCEAAGLDARIRPYWDRGHFVHVQAEVRWPGQPWTLAELIVRGVELGQGPESGARDASGAFVMAGPRPPTGISPR